MLRYWKLMALPISVALIIGCGGKKAEKPEKPMLSLGDKQKIQARITAPYYRVKEITDDGNTVKVTLKFPPREISEYKIAAIANETCQNLVIYLRKTPFKDRRVWIIATQIDTLTKGTRTIGKSIYSLQQNKIEWKAEGGS